MSLFWEKDENKQKEGGFGGPYFKSLVEHIKISTKINIFVFVNAVICTKSKVVKKFK